ncbi:MAG: hypothetical protein HY816_00730 [Candidatus Wallbacteria bacterium]|nr:hypothetical protein [Candidatus Wallbacteria bacterium]
MRTSTRAAHDRAAKDGAGGGIELGGLKVFGCQAACPVCGEPAEGEVRTCEKCGTPHHRDCWDYAGRCALYACEDGIDERTLRPRRVALPRWLTGWLQRRTKWRDVTPGQILFAFFWMVVALELAAIVGYSWLVRSVDAEIRAAAEARGK